MANTKKYKINRVVDEQGTLETVHPETEAGQVLYTGTIGSTAVETVDEAIDALKTLAQNAGVTGVKGSAESTYRIGNVNLTPANIGLGNVTNTSDADKPVSTAQQTAINTAKSGAISEAKTYTDTQLASYIPTSQKGANGGVATLGTDGKVLSSQLPSYVDDIIEGYLYDNKFYVETAHTTQITAETGKIYVDKSTNKTYRWSGTSYVEISASLALGEEAGMAYPGNLGKANANKISGLEDIINEILDDERNVGIANNALALGGVSADQYAKLTDIPEDKLFVIRCNLNGTQVEYFENTFIEIANALEEGKVPIVLAYSYESDYRKPTPYYLQYDGGDCFDFVKTTADGQVEAITLYSSNDADYSSTTPATTVQETGTGAIVSAISKSGNAISVTRRAMQSSDLPNSGVTAGTYSAVTVDAKGRTTAGYQTVEWGTSGQTDPSNSLVAGGLFFELVE